MAWSLLNHMIADRVNELLDAHKDAYPPEVRRWYSREEAAAIIHAVLWGYSVREGSMAGCYAADNLFKALGLKWWTFDEESVEQHRKLEQRLWAEKRHVEAASPLGPAKEVGGE